MKSRTPRFLASFGRTPSLYAPAVAAWCLLAAALRLYKLADANPWWDEGFTFWLASQDVPGMLLRTAGDTHPPLSYLLYQLWMPLAGRAIYALRFQSVLFGVLAVPVCAAAARRLAGPAAGALAGLLLAIAPFHVWWSQQIRMYALVALLCALSIYLVLNAVSKQLSPVSLLVALFLTNLAGLYTLYFFAVLVGLEGFLLAARRRLLPSACCLLPGVLLLPWLAYFRQHAIRFADDAAARLSWPEFLQSSWAELTLGVDTDLQAYTPLLVALGVAALALIVVALRPPSPGPRLPAPGLALWLALLVAGLPLAAYGITLQHGSFYSAAYQTRYDLPALPALAILLAWGMSRLPGPAALLPLALFGGTAAFGLHALYDVRHRTDDYQSLARFVEAYERPGDAILFDPDWNFHLFLLDYRGHLPWESLPIRQPVDAAYAGQVLSRWAAEHRALWLLQESGGHDAGAAHPVRDWLQAHLEQRLTLTIGDRLLALYEPATAAPRGLHPSFAPQIATPAIPGVRGIDRPLADVRPGDVLHVTVYRAESDEAGPRPPVPGPQPDLLIAGQALAGRPLPSALDFSVPIAPGTAAGWQPISLRLPDGRTFPLSNVHLESTTLPRAAGVSPLSRPVGRAFSGQAELTSYELRPGAPRPGQELAVQLQWRALAPFGQNYTVFVHVLDAANRVVAQRDSQPAGGHMPTVGWQPGQTLNDTYLLSLPPELPSGDYQLEIGLYLQSTGQRLPLSDGSGQDRLLLPLKLD